MIKTYYFQKIIRYEPVFSVLYLNVFNVLIRLAAKFYTKENLEIRLEDFRFF